MIHTNERILRFGLIGIAATLIHLGVLYGLSLFITPLSLVNAVAFLIACGFSFNMQQRFTFRDRLQGKTLNKLALILFFMINTALNWSGGVMANETIWLKPLLPLLAAVVNFLTYWLMSSKPIFRS